MDIKNPFDTALEARFTLEAGTLIRSVTGRWGEELKESFIFVIDSVDLAWKGAKAVFENKATPTHALEIYDRVIARLKDMPDTETTYADELAKYKKELVVNDTDLSIVQSREEEKHPAIEDLSADIS